MSSHLYAVQDEQGREIVSAHVDVERVSDVTATQDPDGNVYLLFEDLTIEHAPDPGGKLTLHRWPSDDKLATPVSHPVK